MNGKIATERKRRTKYVVTDWVTANLAFLLFNVARYAVLSSSTVTKKSLFQFLDSNKLLAEQFIIPLVMLGVYWLSGYYNKPFGKSRLQEGVTTLCSSLFNTAMIYLALLTNDQLVHRTTNWLLILVLFGCTTICTYIGRIILTQRSVYKINRLQWRFNTLIIGNSKSAHKLAVRLSRTQSRLGYKVVGFVEIPGETCRQPSDTPLFTFEELDNVIKHHRVDQLIIVPESRNEKKVLQLLHNLYHIDLPIKIAPDTLSFVTSGIRLQDIYGEPFIDLSSPSISESTKNVKRAVDVLASSLALIALSPLYLFLALWVKLDSEGPVFYRQERIGYHRKPFNIIKFRSMRTDAEKEGPQLSRDGDSRITRAGRIMRKYRLDELPQFWNVLKGDMSLVGPRPERTFFIQQIVKCAPFYTLLLQVRPGITSWGMVKYGYASSVEEMIRRARFDLIYLSNMSVAVDMKILIHTVKTIVTGKGV